MYSCNKFNISARIRLLVSPMNSNDNALRTELESFMKDHPRLFGVLFAALMLLSQAGSVAAFASYRGP